jgi:endonuclease YncB( thermonuclease family)
MNVRQLIAGLVFALSIVPSTFVIAAGQKTVHVKPYTRKDGTQVAGHDRKAPEKRTSGATDGPADYKAVAPKVCDRPVGVGIGTMDWDRMSADQQWAACEAARKGPTSALVQVVTRVVDGDTIVVAGIGTVRLIGVDTPETVDPRKPVESFGQEANEAAPQTDE